MALLIQDKEPFYSPNLPVNARPTLDPFTELVDNTWILDTTRLRQAATGANKTWSLSLPWPSESDPDDVRWVIVRSDGEVVSGAIPEGIDGPVSVATLIGTYHWSVGVPGFTQPVVEEVITQPAVTSNNSYPTNDIFFQGPKGDKGDKGDKGETGDQGPIGPNIPATTTTLGSIIVGSGLDVALNGTLSRSALSPNDIPSLDAGKITSGILSLSRLSGITHSQLDASAGILGTQIHDVPASLVTGLLSPLQGGTGLDTSGASNGQILIGTGSGFSLSTITAGTGISITNTSGHIRIDGSVLYSLPPATTTTLGGVIVGSGLAVALDGTLSTLITSPLTNKGDLWGFGSSNARLPAGSPNTFLAVDTAQTLGLVYRNLLATDIPSLDADKITSGVFGTGLIPSLDVSKITTGTFATGFIPNLDASKITTGLLATARGGTGVDSSGAGNGTLLIGTGTGLTLATLTAGTNITITNTSGSIKIDGAVSYDLPIASATVLGGIKVGANLSIDGAGVLSGAAPYTLPTASASTLGGVKVGSNLAIDGSGVLSATYSYTLPVASDTVLGGVKQGSNVTIDGSGVLSVTAPYVLPVATASVLGGVKQGSGVSISGDGTLSSAAGTVTSVALTAPTEISVVGSPITGSGSLDLTWASETQNYVFAAPSASSGTPGFRPLVSDDIPSLDVAKITTGTFATSFIPNLDVAKITTGTFATSFIPNLDAAKITSGTLSLSRLSGITTTELSATAGIVGGQIASVNPSVLTGTGTIPQAANTPVVSTAAVMAAWARYA